MKAFLASIIRHGFTSLGAIAAARGLISDQNQFVEIGVGASLIVIGMVWSYIQKKKTVTKP